MTLGNKVYTEHSLAYARSRCTSQASCIVNLPSGDVACRISLREVEIGYLFCGQEPRKQQRAGDPESSPRGLMVGSVPGRPRGK